MREGEILCVDKNGDQRVFYYKYSEPEQLSAEFRMHIYASSQFNDKDFFEIAAELQENGQLKIVLISKNDDALYGAKGIPEAAVFELAALSGMSVCSSSNISKEASNEYRSENATKFWERLRVRGEAEYDQEKDIYILKNQ